MTSGISLPFNCQPFILADIFSYLDKISAISEREPMEVTFPFWENSRGCARLPGLPSKFISTHNRNWIYNQGKMQIIPAYFIRTFEAMARTFNLSATNDFSLNTILGNLLRPPQMY